MINNMIFTITSLFLPFKNLLYIFLKNSNNLWNSTLVLVEDFNQNQCTVPEIITILQDSTNSMRNLHQLLYILAPKTSSFLL